jgi:hypothetical protein
MSHRFPLWQYIFLFDASVKFGCGIERDCKVMVCLAIMAPKELTRHQISSRLTYNQDTPAFLRKLQNRVAGVRDDDDDDGGGDDYEDQRPKRPPIPERPEGDPGSADEDEGDEKPQIVVLKEGKHLTEKEAEIERRKRQYFLFLFLPV